MYSISLITLKYNFVQQGLLFQHPRLLRRCAPSSLWAFLQSFYRVASFILASSSVLKILSLVQSLEDSRETHFNLVMIPYDKLLDLWKFKTIKGVSRNIALKIHLILYSCLAFNEQFRHVLESLALNTAVTKPKWTKL